MPDFEQGDRVRVVATPWARKYGLVEARGIVTSSTFFEQDVVDENMKRRSTVRHFHVAFVGKGRLLVPVTSLTNAVPLDEKKTFLKAG